MRHIGRAFSGICKFGGINTSPSRNTTRSVAKSGAGVLFVMPTNATIIDSMKRSKNIRPKAVAAASGPTEVNMDISGNTRMCHMIPMMNVAPIIYGVFFINDVNTGIGLK
jgi:hypothetical protein